jgi:hypothetical protein
MPSASAAPGTSHELQRSATAARRLVQPRCQRFGRVTDRHPSGSGPGGRQGTYYVRDDETGTICSFSYADIVTEGFRTIRTGERIRFLTDPADAAQATYVIRLDLIPRTITCRTGIRVGIRSS